MAGNPDTSQPPYNDSLLKVRELRTRFEMRGSVVRAVNGVTYDLEFGESLGIVGESGCGKSVSVLSLLKLLPEPPAVIEADSITFDGKDLLGAAVSRLEKIRGKEIGMIFQDPMTSLNPVLTVGRQIEETLIEHLGYDRRKAAGRAVELLELVGIPEAAQRVKEYPHQFSGGMRQRAMIAMALSCNPKLLIADEPTTALDVTIQAQILNIIKNLTQQFGMSLIMITHSLGVVADICDRVIVMYAGFIVEEASTVELFGNPLHPYTQALLKSIPQIDHDAAGDLPSIEGIPPDLAYLSEECPFKERCKDNCDDERDGNPPIVEVHSGHFVRCWKRAS